MVKYNLEEDKSEFESERKTWDQIFLKDFIFRDNKLIAIKNLNKPINKNLPIYIENGNLLENIFKHKSLNNLAYFLSEFGKILPKYQSGLSSRMQKKTARLVRNIRSNKILNFKECINSSDLLDFDEDDF